MTDIDPNNPNWMPLNSVSGAVQNAQYASTAPSPLPSANTTTGFGSARSGKGTGSSNGIALLVIIVGGFLWFSSATPHETWDRFVKIGHTLGSILLNPPDESKVIILLLVSMTVAAFIQMMRDQKQLSREEAALASLRTKLWQQGGRVELQDLTDSLKDQTSDSVLVRAVRAVWQARNLQTPDLEAISAAIFVLEAKRSSLGRSVANRLLLLSLLGTVIGLAGVIGTLQSQIGSGAGVDPDTLLPKLQETLTTMGTAFASTAYGIILCVFIASRASSGNERRSHHVAEVQYFAVCELAPRLLPVSLPQAIAQIEALVWQSEAFVVESRSLLDETRSQNVKYLDETRSQNVKYLRDLDQTIQENTQKTANVVAGIETIIRAAAQEVHDALADAGKYVVDGAKAQITVAKSLDKLLGESTTSMENAAADLKAGMQDLSGASTIVQSAYKGLNSAVTDLKTSLDGQAQAISDAARGRLADAAAAATMQQAAIKQMSDAAAAASVAQQAAMKRVSDDVTTALTNLTTQISDFVRRSEPKLPSEQEWTRLQKTLDRCVEASASFATAVGRIEKEGFTSAASRPTAAVSAGVTSSEMQGILNAVTRQVTESITAAPQPLREDLRVFSQDMRQALQRMEQLSQQAAQRRPEQLPYRSPSATAEPRPQIPYGGSTPSQSNARYDQQTQGPIEPLPPVQMRMPPPAPTPEKRGWARWWPFGKKG